MTFDENFVENLNKNLKKRPFFEFYDYIQRFLPLLKDSIRNQRMQPVEHAKIEMSTREIIDVVLLFYKDFDKELYNKLNDTLMENSFVYKTDSPTRSHLSKNFFDEHKDELEGKSTIFQYSEPTQDGGVNAVGVISFDEKNYREINLNPRNNIDSLVVIAHEFAHALAQRVQEFKVMKADAACEIESLFIEHVVVDYFKNIGILTEINYKNSLTQQKNNYLSCAYSILDENKIAQHLKYPVTKNSLENFEKKFQDRPDYEKVMETVRHLAEPRADFEGMRKFRYVVGGVVATELYKDFKKDKENTVKKYKEFLNKNAELTLEEAAQFLLGNNYIKRIQSACVSGLNKNL